MRQSTQNAENRLTRDPPRVAAVTTSCLVSAGGGSTLSVWESAPLTPLLPLHSLSDNEEWGCGQALRKGRRKSHPCLCLWVQRCPRGFRDSWAGRAEPAPPLRSANAWQGAHRAAGLHLLRPEAGNARPTALPVETGVYSVVSHPQLNLHTSLH